MLKHWWVKPSHTCIETGWQLHGNMWSLGENVLSQTGWRVFAGGCLQWLGNQPPNPQSCWSVWSETPLGNHRSLRKSVYFPGGSWQSLGEIYQKQNCIKCCTTNLFAIDSLLHGRHQWVLPTLNYSSCGSKSVRRPFTFTVNAVPCNIFQQAQLLL